MPERYRPNWLDIDLDALTSNAALLAGIASPAALCAVVKADGYGHGAADAARAALAGGASGLAVALVEEGVALREAGVEAPVLLLSEPSSEGLAEAVRRGLTPTLYTPGGVEVVARLAAAQGRRIGVQVKLDTGMHRVGASPEQLGEVLERVSAAGGILVEALWSHLAVADDPDDPFTAVQLERLLDAYRRFFPGPAARRPALHLANSAGALAHPATRLDMVRCGISLYGYDPSRAAGAARAVPERLAPVLSWKARVHLVRSLQAGEAMSYGLLRPLAGDSDVAVVPAGYHDGVPRRLFHAGGEVLIGGRRRPIAGQVTMDQVLVDCGPGSGVRPGDEVVLLGSQGDETVTADEWAERLGTISYEVLCGIGPRVPRRAVSRSAGGGAGAGTRAVAGAV